MANYGKVIISSNRKERFLEFLFFYVFACLFVFIKNLWFCSKKFYKFYEIKSKFYVKKILKNSMFYVKKIATLQNSQFYHNLLLLSENICKLFNWLCPSLLVWAQSLSMCKWDVCAWPWQHLGLSFNIVLRSCYIYSGLQSQMAPWGPL